MYRSDGGELVSASEVVGSEGAVVRIADGVGAGALLIIEAGGYRAKKRRSRGGSDWASLTYSCEAMAAFGCCKKMDCELPCNEFNLQCQDDRDLPQPQPFPSVRLSMKLINIILFPSSSTRDHLQRIMRIKS